MRPEYGLGDFVERSRTAMNIASDRVKAKYGFPYGLALEPLQKIESKAPKFSEIKQPKEKFIKFNN